MNVLQQAIATALASGKALFTATVGLFPGLRNEETHVTTVEADYTAVKTAIEAKDIDATAQALATLVHDAHVAATDFGLDLEPIVNLVHASKTTGILGTLEDAVKSEVASQVTQSNQALLVGRQVLGQFGEAQVAATPQAPTTPLAGVKILDVVATKTTPEAPVEVPTNEEATETPETPQEPTEPPAEAPQE